MQHCTAMPRGPGLLSLVFDAPVDRPNGSPVVALTPDALDACREMGLHPNVVDDLVDRIRVLPDSDDYLRWQYRWFHDLDDSSDADGSLVACTNALKLAMDSLVTIGRLAEALLEVVAPAAVEFIGPDRGVTADDPLGHGLPMFYSPLHGDLPLWGPTVRSIAEDRGIEFAARPGGTRSRPIARSETPRDRLVSRLVRASSPARRFDALNRWRVGRSGGSVLTTWAGGYGSQQIARDAHHRGQRVLTLERDRPTTRILEPALTGWRARSRPIDTTPRLAHPPGTPGFDEVVRVSATASRDIDRWTTTPLSPMIRSRVEALVGRVAPTVSVVADGLVPDLERLGISTVVSSNPWALEEFAALRAASRIGASRVLAQHGDHLFPYDDWLVGETNNFDVMLTSDRTLLDDLPEAGHRLGFPVPTLQPSDHRRVRPVRYDRAGPVCYVPTMLMGDNFSLPTWSNGDGAWYHRWHLQLLEWMQRRPETKFVWKTMHGTNQVPDRIVDRIVTGAPNVSYETRPLRTVLRDMSRIVIDTPSTALYESEQAGLPVCLLVFDRFANLRPRAAERFASSIRRCADPDQALRELTAWLGS